MALLGTGSIWVADLGTESQLSLLLLKEKNHFWHPLPIEDLVRPDRKCSGSIQPLRIGIYSYCFEQKGVKAIVVPSIAFVTFG